MECAKRWYAVLHGVHVNIRTGLVLDGQACPAARTAYGHLAKACGTKHFGTPRRGGDAASECWWWNTCIRATGPWDFVLSHQAVICAEL